MQPETRADGRANVHESTYVLMVESVVFVSGIVGWLLILHGGVSWPVGITVTFASLVLAWTCNLLALALLMITFSKTSVQYVLGIANAGFYVQTQCVVLLFMTTICLWLDTAQLLLLRFLHVSGAQLSSSMSSDIILKTSAVIFLSVSLFVWLFAAGVARDIAAACREFAGAPGASPVVLRGHCFFALLLFVQESLADARERVCDGQPSCELQQGVNKDYSMLQQSLIVVNVGLLTEALAIFLGRPRAHANVLASILFVTLRLLLIAAFALLVTLQASLGNAGLDIANYATLGLYSITSLVDIVLFFSRRTRLAVIAPVTSALTSALPSTANMPTTAVDVHSSKKAVRFIIRRQHDRKKYE